jgi:hypothetical protein
MPLLLPLVSLLPSLIGASPVNVAQRDAAPCAQIISALKPIANPPPGSKDLGTVPGQLAYDCLKSIPINDTAALELVRTVRPYLNFQSTLAFLKNPTREYATKIQPPVDLMGDLDRISYKIQGGEYESEYDVCFQLEYQYEAN